MINELLPAEWFPIRRTLIFFLGADRLRPSPLAMGIKPGTRERKATLTPGTSLQRRHYLRNLHKKYCQRVHLVSDLPRSESVYKSWHSFKIRSLMLTVALSGALADDLCFPEGILNERKSKYGDFSKKRKF